jgi:hypothetical protein
MRVQRLGYLLDLTEHRDLADKLAPAVVARAKDVAPLVRAKSRSGAPRDERWKLARALYQRKKAVFARRRSPRAHSFDTPA